MHHRGPFASSCRAPCKSRWAGLAAPPDSCVTVAKRVFFALVHIVTVGAYCAKHSSSYRADGWLDALIARWKRAASTPSLQLRLELRALATALGVIANTPRLRWLEVAGTGTKYGGCTGGVLDV